jgi:hypothetical protein
MHLSLITIYRRRQPHLDTQLTWWQHLHPTLPACEWIVIEADTTPSPGLAQQLHHHQAHYAFLPNPGTLHKTKALNLGLHLAQGDYLAPLDVDLIPIGTTLADHLHLATLSPQLLITGYRLMAATPSLDFDQMPQALEQSAIAPEDQPTALRKHLLHGEKFGVMPYFDRQRLLEIHGWDEAYIGWGAEDQDLIERYLGTSRYLCRSPHLVYLHLHHNAEPHWREDTIVATNRQTYYQKRHP